MVELFATNMNHNLLLGLLPVPEADALNIDALNILLEGLDCYAVCPVALIPKKLFSK